MLLPRPLGHILLFIFWVFISHFQSSELPGYGYIPELLGHAACRDFDDVVFTVNNPEVSKEIYADAIQRYKDFRYVIADEVGAVGV